MPLTCFIRHPIDPFQRDAYEHYRAALKADAEGQENFRQAQRQRFILREERSWLEDVPATRNRSREVQP